MGPKDWGPPNHPKLDQNGTLFIIEHWQFFNRETNGLGKAVQVVGYSHNGENGENQC